jgi:hypothetical protein
VPSIAAKTWRIAPEISGCWGLADVAEHVPEEVHGAAQPGRAEDLRDRGLQPRMRVGDNELDARQTARDERTQELAPKRSVSASPASRPMISRLAGLVDAVGDDQALLPHTAALADALDLRIEPQVGVAGAVQRPVPECGDLLVQTASRIAVAARQARRT